MPERARRNPLATRTQEGVYATACWEAVSRPIQVLNDLHRHADSINDRVAGAELTNDHDLRTGAGRSCTSRRVRSAFALVESTESAGGFSQFRSPLIRRSSSLGSGALDPVRDVARVITVATRDCVVIGAWAGRVGERVAVHQPDAGDLGQQGCIHGCETSSVGDRADAEALLGVVLAHLAGVGEVASRSPGATREISCSGRPVHMSTSSGSAIKVCTWCATLTAVARRTIASSSRRR